MNGRGGVLSSALAWLAAVTLAGLIVRAVPIALTDFPVNDGGLFVAMVRAIQDAGWWLPASLAWNGADLPFIYPPLGFYAAGALETALGVDLFAVFRWLPLFTSALIVPAVYLLARELLRSEVGGLVAALAYALAPSSYVWMVQGGGVTRSPGLLLGVLTVWQVVLLVREPGRKRAVLVGLLAGLTGLVHPGATVFVALSAGLIWAFEGRSVRSLLFADVAVVISLLVVAPWLLAVVSRHGFAALLDVPSNGPDIRSVILALLAGRYTGIPFTDPVSIIGLVAAILCLLRRQFLLPIWFGAATLASYQYGMVPLSLLIGVVAMDLVALRGSAATRKGAGVIRFVPTVGIVLIAGSLLVQGVASAATVLNSGAPVHALDSERRSAMAWVASNLESDARVAVITDSVWSSDQDAEWFPLLAQRRSVATVQGSEWLGEPAFNRQQQAHHALQGCVRPASVSCVHDWLADWPADYLYLPTGPLHGPSSLADCCADLRAGLLVDPAFTPIYEGPGATIFRVDRQASSGGG